MVYTMNNCLQNYENSFTHSHDMPAGTSAMCLLVLHFYMCVLCNLPESLINWCCQLKKKILLYIAYIFRNVLEKLEC